MRLWFRCSGTRTFSHSGRQTLGMYVYNADSHVLPCTVCRSLSSSASPRCLTEGITVRLQALKSGRRLWGTQTHSPLLCCVDSKMYNLSDALGRPLFSNIQISLVCGKNCLLESTLLASLPTTASLVRSCVPEDRRAREVHTQVGGDAALAVVQQDGDREGHPCRCAYVLASWSPDAEHVCAQC